MDNASIRKLARTSYWQGVYQRAKDLNMNLFNNVCDFTPVQVEFLQWLEIYNSIYIDLNSGKDGIDTRVIENDFLCDGYLLVTSENRKKEMQELKNPNKKKKASNSKIPKISFV